MELRVQRVQMREYVESEFSQDVLGYVGEETGFYLRTYHRQGPGQTCGQGKEEVGLGLGIIFNGLLRIINTMACRSRVVDGLTIESDGCSSALEHPWSNQH